MDINKAEYAEVVEVFKCPNCEEYFNFAPRCPHCGQLIKNGKANVENVMDALRRWRDGKDVAEIPKPPCLYIINALEIGAHALLYRGEYSTICLDEVNYWKAFGFTIVRDGVGWKIS